MGKSKGNIYKKISSNKEQGSNEPPTLNAAYEPDSYELVEPGSSENLENKTTKNKKSLPCWFAFLVLMVYIIFLALIMLTVIYLRETKQGNLILIF
jgi:hypothetical protein